MSDVLKLSNLISINSDAIRFYLSMNLRSVFTFQEQTRKHDYSLIYPISILAKDDTVMGLIKKNKERGSTKRVVNLQNQIYIEIHLNSRRYTTDPLTIEIVTIPCVSW